MFRILFVSAILFFITAGYTCAGFSSATYDTSNVVVAAVEIEGKGIYNLITSIQFLRTPKDNKVFGSDDYEYLINQLNVESKGVILQRILSTQALKMTDFSTLKLNIEKDIQLLIEKTKKQHDIAPDTAVIFAIGTIYLDVPGT